MTVETRAISTSVFLVRSFDIDAYGYVRPARVAGYLQQAASDSADALGIGLSDLNSSGLTWVLVRQQWECRQPIMLGDEISIETWPSGVDRLTALRDSRLLKDGQEIGRAVTGWFVLDLANRRPVRPSVILKEPMASVSTHILPPATESIATLTNFTEQRPFAVRYSDIDVNHHVTNATYIDWALDAIDACTWTECRLAALDLQFMAECRLGSTVISRAIEQRSGCWLHSIVRESDQKELARAVSTWVQKGLAIS